MKSLKEDIKDAKNELDELKENYFEKSFASILLGDYKKINKRMFIIWLITFIALICVVIYCIYLLNDIETIESIEEYTQEITDIETIENSSIDNGGNK